MLPDVRFTQFPMPLIKDKSSLPKFINTSSKFLQNNGKPDVLPDTCAGDLDANSLCLRVPREHQLGPGLVMHIVPHVMLVLLSPLNM